MRKLRNGILIRSQGYSRASLVVQMVKKSAMLCRRLRFHPWVGMIPWKREWQPTPGFLPGEFHGQRSLAGTVHGVAELDTAEQLTHKVIQRISGKGTFWIQVCQFQGLWFSHWIQKRGEGRVSDLERKERIHTCVRACVQAVTVRDSKAGRCLALIWSIGIEPTA